jgi:hypothetical protein
VPILLALVSVALLCARPQVAQAAVTSPAFPRLAVWWPDADTQPIADLAKCDWIALQNGDARHIAALRAANPDIIVLGDTSARELNYVLGDYSSSFNAALRSVSTDWMLTQVGSTLTAAVTASTTAIPVADVTKFAVGQMLLVDHELMLVQAIGTSGLTVMARGPVNPPAAHAAGTRIAAVVSNWPGSITFDMSTNCPKVDVGDGYGAETWDDWNVHRGCAILASADWDGLLIDCLESNPSWMVGGGRNASIDPLRTNKPVTDGYASFDAAWNVGAVAYGNALKAASGGKILIGNGNERNYNLNGNIFEEFPYAGIALSTWNIVFVGPYSSPHASYPEWCANAASPNLTLMQAYGAPDDYQLMRFSLCSTLMGDGYYSYALSSGVHASGGLDWFDEYDGGGIGRGYLGQPTGAAIKVGNAWRRDYSGGVALVNPSTSPVTVQLGGPFRKIKGTQDPTVNDGSAVTAVTIPAQDGIILLRAPAPVTYTLAYSAGSGGTISGSAAQTVNAGASGTTVTAVASSGYSFVSWSDGVTTAARADADAAADLSVTASFAVTPAPAPAPAPVPTPTPAPAPVTYTLSYSAGSGGTISGSGAQVVNAGAAGTAVTAVAASGYHFVSWSDGVTSAARTDANVTANLSATANFAVTAPTITKLTAPSRVKVRKTLKLSGTVSMSAFRGASALSAVPSTLATAADASTLTAPAVTSTTPAPVLPRTIRIVKSRLVHGKWRTAGSVTVKVVSGTFSYAFKPTARGSWRFVATTPAGTIGAAVSSSGARIVLVK